MKSPEEVDSLAKYQRTLLDSPAMTVAEREELIVWIDEIRNIVSSVLYAVMPKELWDTAPDKLLSVELLGSCNHSQLPNGMYLLDLPEGADSKYKNPVARALAFLAQAPKTLRFVPEVMSILLPEPTSHDRMGAKIFLRDMAKQHENDKDVLEWLSLLN